MTTLEHRRVPHVEFRVRPDGKEGRVLADVLIYDRMDDYRTSFAPGTFSQSLQNHLPKMVWGHNWLEPIGRWIDADDNSTRMRLLGELDLEMTEHGQMIVPQAHRAWLQMEKRTVDQFSIGFVRMQDEAHPNVRGAKRITLGSLDEVSPVVVGSVPGTQLIGTRSSLREGVLGRGERRKMFNMEMRKR